MSAPANEAIRFHIDPLDIESDGLKLCLRPLKPSDSLQKLTHLLHRAYQPLLAQGLRYVATHQDVDITKRRIAAGSCLVLTQSTKLVGTVCLYGPGTHLQNRYFQNQGVAHFGQFAVDPKLKGRGLGSRIMDVIEESAARHDYRELALDTSDKATRLIEFYKRRDYKIVDRVDWSMTNYVSVVMSKILVERGRLSLGT